MKRALPLLLLLAGCASTPCVPRVETVSVNVPVPVKCIDAADVPREPGSTLLVGDARQDADALGAKVLDLRKWGRSLVAMMGPCER